MMIIMVIREREREDNIVIIIIIVNRKTVTELRDYKFGQIDLKKK